MAGQDKRALASENRLILGWHQRSNGWVVSWLRRANNSLRQARFSPPSGDPHLISRESSRRSSKPRGGYAGADAGQIFLVDGDRYRFAYGSGVASEYRDLITNHPDVSGSGGRWLGGSGLTGGLRRSQTCSQTPTTTDQTRSGSPATGHLMGVRMLLDGEVVGVLSVWRTGGGSV